MLASIHPLGERARGRRWGSTVTAFIAGAVVAGALAGGVLGAAGALVREHAGIAVTAVLAAVIGAAGILLDVGIGGLRLPTVHRQVNEDWLHRYRGGVYGFGFGFQLGLGVVTIVTTAAVYLTFVLAFLTASVAGGAAIGATFGLVRGASLLTVAGVDSPQELWARHRRMQRWAARSRNVTVAAEVVAVAVLLLVAVG
jgi:hypothetical protein